ncbi:MAG: ABC transporter permease [Gammaproteobacteria bacterium]|nr:ABC transporter permease [Gammaproteobacteria bacterium]
MRALNHKLVRELWQLRGQALAIALVIGAGLAAVLMSISTLDSLQNTRAIYYRDYAFAEVFASLKRAPDSLRERIAAIPGVNQVNTRVWAPVTIEIAGFTDPISGLLVSAPRAGRADLNRLYLRAGRLMDPDRSDEIVIGDAFAEAHGFQPGDRLGVIIDGKRKQLRIVGIALSPEFIYQIGPGSIFPDFARFAVLWMAPDVLATAYDMDGAFNNVTLTLTHGANAADVIDELDTVLERYGGLSAYDREDQTSHRFLSEEFKQLEQMGRTFSVIFLGISAFLLNMVISRLINTQREEIATLKAFGYSNLAIGAHYAKLVVAIVLFGIVLGVIAGVWFGQGLSHIYMEYYRLPYLHYQLRPVIVLVATLVTASAALIGTLFALQRAVRLPPAQAMRPEPPPVYRATVVERLGVQRWLSQPSRMILRHIERRPLKAALSVIGIAFAGGIVISGTFFKDSIDFMVEAEFRLAQREDIAVTFTEATSYAALHELAALPGVTRVEPVRVVPVRLRHGHHVYRTSVQGLAPNADLHRSLDLNLQPLAFPPQGILLTEYLGTRLAIKPGDTLTIEVLDGSQPVREVPLVGLVQQYIGVGGYMDLDALNRLLREDRAVSGAFLAVDEADRETVYARLKTMPRIASVRVQENSIRNYYASIGDLLLTYTAFIAGLAGAITFGVVYNSARITLSERSRELASLRVLGFTRGEIAYILLGELALLTLAAIPLGFVVGRALSAHFVATIHQELFRVPLILEPDTYTLSAIVILISALVSGLIVRRRLDQLDLIAVLKTKE